MILELQHRRPDGDVDTYHLKPGRRYHLGRGSGCEVRILDLKLSRKHAALEFLDQRWQLIDLCSTNGCRLNGELVVGTNPLAVGSEIEIGQTILVIAGIGAGQQAPPVSDEFTPQDSAGGTQRALADRTGISAEFPPSEFSHESSANFRPSAQPPEIIDHREIAAITPVAAHPIVPENPPPVVVPVRPKALPGDPIRPVVLKSESDDLVATVADKRPPIVIPAAPTQLAQAPEITSAAAPSDERSYFITVLGKRIGPLSRAVARDLKARELKGTLRPADIAAYPAA